MKLNYDKHKLAEKKKYNERNLVQCRCGEHWFPSKKMFIEFLKQYKDVDGEADIWSIEDWETGQVTIHIELSYMTPDYNPPKSKITLVTSTDKVMLCGKKFGM